jgi:hypothetical protein
LKRESFEWQSQADVPLFSEGAGLPAIAVREGGGEAKTVTSFEKTGGLFESSSRNLPFLRENGWFLREFFEKRYPFFEKAGVSSRAVREKRGFVRENRCFLPERFGRLFGFVRENSAFVAGGYRVSSGALYTSYLHIRFLIWASFGKVMHLFGKTGGFSGGASGKGVVSSGKQVVYSGAVREISAFVRGALREKVPLALRNSFLEYPVKLRRHFLKCSSSETRLFIFQQFVVNRIKQRSNFAELRRSIRDFQI